MHEASVARSLIELVADELAARAFVAGAEVVAPLPRVAAVRVRLGRLGSVVPAALRSAFDAAKSQSPCRAARLEVEWVEARVWCDACDAPRDLIDPSRLRCPACGARCPKLLAGHELELAAIELAADAT